jgi:integrase
MAKGNVNPLDSARKRAALPPRKEPYWVRIKTGQFIGYRVPLDGSAGTWHARLIQNRRKNEGGLHLDGAADYNAAVDSALAWFKAVIGTENEDRRYSIGDAIADYVDALKVNNSQQAAQDTEDRLKKHVPESIRKIELATLTKPARLRKWQQSLVRISDDPEDVRKSKDTANRLLNMIKAALNLAYQNGYASTDAAWKRIKPFRNVGSARILFLTDEQVKALLDHAKGTFHDLLQAAKHTGGRYGELITLRVEDLDLEQGTLRMNGKTGERLCYLSDMALAWFKGQAKNKLPKAILLPRDDGEPWGKSHQHRPMQAAVRAAKLPAETVFYSLRHYHISKALAAGVPVQVVAENCGTSVRMIEKHYGKFLPQDRRDFFNAVKLG